ncbi:MAG: hypothetical protein KDG55_24660, partial [Rhodocyclaceae bacterium]|nr:hypothetical protein [Rhodocyclaceae bacterium]
MSTKFLTSVPLVSDFAAACQQPLGRPSQYPPQPNPLPTQGYRSYPSVVDPLKMLFTITHLRNR